MVAACERRELLLVLDNCEHLLDAAAQMVEALERACPGVQVLATSREGLGVSGERILVLRSLGLPADDATRDDAAGIDAVRLFVERAAAVRDGFTLTADNVDAIVQICRRLDGIPLAIELAAARARMMSPMEIAARLDERFRLLTGGSRTAVERHQTLRQAVDWSYDLLEARERRVFNRLSVFAGGFTFEAAEAVAADHAIDGFDLLDAVGQLVDKSLLVAVETDDGTRYRFLETIRQYGLDRLDEAGETDEVRLKHAEWVVAFVARVAMGWRGPDEHRWVDALSIEFENLRAALTWAVDREQLDLAVGMLSGFDSFRLLSSTLGYRVAPLGAIVLAVDGAADHPRRTSLLTLRSIDHLHHDRLQAAMGDAEAAVAAMDAGREFLGVAVDGAAHGPRVRGHLGQDRRSVRRVPARRPRLRQRLRARRHAAAGRRGALRCAPGRGSARACAEEAVVVARRSGSPTQRAVSTNLLAVMLFDEDPARALQLAARGTRHLRSRVGRPHAGHGAAAVGPPRPQHRRSRVGAGVPSLPRGCATGR